MNQWMHECGSLKWQSLVYISKVGSDSIRKHWCSNTGMYLKQCLNYKKHKIPHRDLFSSSRIPP